MQPWRSNAGKESRSSKTDSKGCKTRNARIHQHVPSFWSEPSQQTGLIPLSVLKATSKLQCWDGVYLLRINWRRRRRRRQQHQQQQARLLKTCELQKWEMCAFNQPTCAGFQMIRAAFSQLLNLILGLGNYSLHIELLFVLWGLK